MSIISIQEPQVTFSGSGREPERRRVLLFDGGDHGIASAAPALAGLGLEVVAAEPRSAPIAPSADTLLAVVVSSGADDSRETSALVHHLREVDLFDEQVGILEAVLESGRERIEVL